MERSEAINGSLLGTAAGDAIGLPFEGVSARRAQRLFGGPGRHHFLFGHGMVSDDTEHAAMVAQCVIESHEDVERFTRRLAWRFRLWFLGLPAGIGLATLRACLKLMIGFPPRHSGVWSAGNGPAMRAPLLGVLFGDQPDLMRTFVEASTRITHRDPKAFYGALAVALAAWQSTGDDPVNGGVYLAALHALLVEDYDAQELLGLLNEVESSVASGETTAQFAAAHGLERGITGYVYHTVPVVIHAWLRNADDFGAGIDEIIRLGGDTDTTAAILGGILGARCGSAGIPDHWLKGIADFPRSVKWLRRLAGVLAGTMENRVSGKAPRLPVSGIAVRNLLFTVVVLLHGFRRLLPPY